MYVYIGSSDIHSTISFWKKIRFQSIVDLRSRMSIMNYSKNTYNSAIIRINLLFYFERIQFRNSFDEEK